jgi:hypothetical protein
LPLVVVIILFDNTSGVALAVKAVLNVFLVYVALMASSSFSEHVGDLLDCHIDLVVVQEGCDLCAVQRIVAVRVQLLKHVVYDPILLHFRHGRAVMLVGVLTETLVEVCLEVTRLKYQLPLLLLVGFRQDSG